MTEYEICAKHSCCNCAETQQRHLLFIYCILFVCFFFLKKGRNVQYVSTLNVLYFSILSASETYKPFILQSIRVFSAEATAAYNKPLSIELYILGILGMNFSLHMTLKFMLF